MVLGGRRSRKVQRRALPEILDYRRQTRSMLITSQLPLELRYDYLADPTLADAILDCLVHAVYKVALRGESMRNRNSTLTEETVRR
jgi:DNA replication protein DnaC